eukprot:COSAG02_NODE_3650_length_6422_cov_15.219516_5_plen_121_part_00
MRAALFFLRRSSACWTALCGGSATERGALYPAHAALREVEAALADLLADNTPATGAATGKAAEGESSASRGGRGKASKQRRRKLNRKVWEIVQSDEYLKEAELLGHSVPKLNQQVDRPCD